MDMANTIDVYRRVFDAVNRDDEAALDHLLTADVIDHNPVPGQVPGIPGFKQWLRYVRAAFPDVHVTVEDVLSQGDRVAGRVTWRGTHNGPLVGIAGSGKPVEFTAIHIVRFENGKAAEWWGVADLLGALIQTGAQVTAPTSG
jgi:predicted ester cyclase